MKVWVKYCFHTYRGDILRICDRSLAVVMETEKILTTYPKRKKEKKGFVITTIFLPTPSTVHYSDTSFIP